MSSMPDLSQGTEVWRVSTPAAKCVHRIVPRTGHWTEASQAGQHSYHPAQTLCLLVWIRGGGMGLQSPCDSVEPVFQGKTLGDGVWFRGPTSTPWVGFPTPGTEKLLVWLYPDVVQRLFGIAPGEYCDCWVPWAYPLVNRLWGHWGQSILEADWSQGTPATLNEGLAEENGIDVNGSPGWFGDLNGWHRQLINHLERELKGRSRRTWQRMYRRMVGVSPSEIERQRRVDATIQVMLNQAVGEKLNLGQLAFQQGYCDQSHLVRSIRQVTGFSPRSLISAVSQQLGMWPYRIQYWPDQPQPKSCMDMSVRKTRDFPQGQINPVNGGSRVFS